MDPSFPEASPATPRSIQDARDMAVAVQANLVQLKVADTRRRGVPTDAHDVTVRPPGFVRRFRETLIDRRVLAGYRDVEVTLRLREMWGQHCAFQWLFHRDVAAGDEADHDADDAKMRCPSEVDVKRREVHALLWRIRYEQRRRGDAASTGFAPSDEERRFAREIPAELFGKRLADCSDDELLCGACEYAGMLAALRWVLDAKRSWGSPGIMDVADRPF